MSPRVLHIVENLDRGAVENWLVRMLEHAQSQQINLDWTFYCAVGRPGSLDDKVRALGGKIYYSPVPLSEKLHFTRALRAELHRGAYEVMHCHHDLLSAVYLIASFGLQVQQRLVHVHNADEVLPTHSVLKQQLYREPMRQICLKMADHIIGNSNHTLDTFLGGRPRRPRQDIVHYYGIDPQRFSNMPNHRLKFRHLHDLPDDALILLFGGRLVQEKNPIFVVDVLSKLRHIEPRAVAVFAGAGSCEDAIDARARDLAIEGAVRQLGWRSDLPEVMSSCDWFVLPHPEHPIEGFGLAVVEAQLAGLRLLVSRGVPDDPLLPTAVFRRLPLADNPEEWAKAALALVHGPKSSASEAIGALAKSPMNMDVALAHLCVLHQGTAAANVNQFGTNEPIDVN